MEFTNRSEQPQAAAPSAHSGTAGSPAWNKRSTSEDSKWTRIAFVAAVVAVVILIIASAIVAGTNNNNANFNEGQYVDSSKLQAVFLNTGQVYFGHINKLNSQYFVVKDIYYLQTANSGSTGSSSTANTNVSLVKLGCELHQPLDQMVINRSQVTFWENLSPNGQVAKAVAAFQQKNPNGQKCVDQSSSSSSSSSSSTQPASTSTTPVKP